MAQFVRVGDPVQVVSGKHKDMYGVVKASCGDYVSVLLNNGISMEHYAHLTFVRAKLSWESLCEGVTLVYTQDKSYRYKVMSRIGDLVIMSYFGSGNNNPSVMKLDQLIGHYEIEGIDPEIEKAIRLLKNHGFKITE